MVLLLVSVLGSCGQKGDLFLAPDDDEEDVLEAPDDESE
jgi:predicted small lipoprotein YifL